MTDRQRKEMKSDIQADKYRQTDTDTKKRTEANRHRHNK